MTVDSTTHACQADESPALIAYDLAGAPEWSSCSQAGWGVLVGTTDEVILSVLPPTATVVMQADSSGTVPNIPPATGEEFRPSLTASNARTGDRIWRASLAFSSVTIGGSFVAGNVAVVVLADDNGGGEIAALVPATGDVRWRLPAVGDAHVVANTADVVLVQGPGEVLHGLERSTGSELWSASLYATRATVDGDTVVVQPTVGAPVALDAHTGAVKWTSDFLGFLGGAADGVVVFGGQDFPISAVDASTGTHLWTGRSGHEGFDTVWAIGDGGVFVRDGDHVVAYELRTGAERWRRDESTGKPWLVAGESLFVAGSDLTVLSTADGSTRWTTEGPGGNSMVRDVITNRNSVFVSFGAAGSD